MLPGQDAWSIDDNAVSASIVTGTVAAGTTYSGTQALQVAPTPPGSSYTFRPTPAIPAVDGAVIRGSFAMKIVDGSTRSSAWGAVALDGSITTIVAQALVTSQGAIVAQDGLSGFPVSAPGLVTRDAWHSFELRMNYTSQTYRVYLDGVPVSFSLLGQTYVDLELNPGDGVFGELDYQNTAVNGSNDYALFDDHSIVASPVPEPAAIAGIAAGAAGCLVRRRHRRA